MRRRFPAPRVPPGRHWIGSKPVAAVAGFPIRVTPAPGEAIDSWLEATAIAMDLSMGSVVRWLKLPAVTKPQWLSWMPRDQLDLVASAAGTSAQVIQRMSLTAYDSRALHLDATSHLPDGTFPFGPLFWSRFCPDCLAESGGRWRLEWRLGWSFACAGHRRLLADHCPSCEERQRRLQFYSGIPAPAQCRCGYSLRHADTPRLEVGHPFIEAQLSINAIVDGERPTTGVLARVGSCREALESVRSLANRTLNYAAVHGLAQAASGGVLCAFAGIEAAPKPFRARGPLNVDPPTRSVETAVGVTVALDILSASSLSESADRARRLVEGQNADTGPAELRSCGADQPLATAVVIKASSRRLGPELQLRYRLSASSPRSPDRDPEQVARMADALPRKMWPGWSRVLLPRQPITDARRAELTIATLIVGSTVRPVDAAKMIGEIATANALNQRLCVLCGLPHWRSISDALIRLNDYLVNFGSPIDYARRRRLDFTGLLERDDWIAIRMSVDDPVVRTTSVTAARRHLIERLTGSTPPMTRQVDMRTPPNAEQNVLNIVDVQMLDRAEKFLRRCNIDEPVEWQPPLSIMGVTSTTS